MEKPRYVWRYLSIHFGSWLFEFIHDESFWTFFELFTVTIFNHVVDNFTQVCHQFKPPPYISRKPLTVTDFTEF